MATRISEALPEFTIPFTVLEAILADAHNIASTKRSPFMGRLKNLARLGLVAHKRPGKGLASEYDLEDVLKYAVACQLLDSGLMPDMAVRIIPQVWPVAWPSIDERCGAQGASIFLGLNMQALISLAVMGHTADGMERSPLASFRVTDNLREILDNMDRRVLIINLSAIVQKTIAALYDLRVIPLRPALVEAA
jgi:hypothetical protein